MIIRAAAAADLDAIVDMTEARRVQYEQYQPTFWGKAPDSADQARAFLDGLVAEAGCIFLVAESDDGLLGFIVARPVPAPPVYAPGGKTFLIDDFCVDSPGLWSSAGIALLERVTECARDAGAAQIVVVCANRDTSKADILRRANLSIASNWWTVPL
jgi:hypothetical protein